MEEGVRETGLSSFLFFSIARYRPLLHGESFEAEPLHAVLRMTFSWSRITTAVPSQRISGDRQHSTGLWLSVPDIALRDSSDVLLCGHEAFPFAVEHGEDG